MYLLIISLLASSDLVSAYIHNISGVEYIVNISLEHGRCLIYKNKQQLLWTANVTYLKSYLKVGWDFIQVVTNPNTDDMIQAYTAGYCEGALTCDSIYNHWTNTLKKVCARKNEICDKINRYLKEYRKWINTITKTDTNDPFWHQIKLFYSQIDGIFQGQKRCTENSLSKKKILWLNMATEIQELAYALNKSQIHRRRMETDHCSAIIKLLHDYSDLLVGHNTWNGYEWMLRQAKKYSFGYHLNTKTNKRIPGSTMAFSGYPGIIASMDDFYVIDSGLVVLETTIGNDNKTLYVNPESPVDKISTIARSVVANRLARNGSEWVEIFKFQNNGLYNNQYMIVDMKRFSPGSPPDSGTLWILEQIPGWILAEDKTDVLISQSYWPSYNRPYFPTIFNISGQEELVNEYGDWYSYENTPRAKIFQRDQSSVTNLRTLMYLMRSNNYRNDPFSRCNCTPPFSAVNAIASRGDLNPSCGTYPFMELGFSNTGAIDAKLTNYQLSKSLQFVAICGPTTGTNLPDFDWRINTVSYGNHSGHPDVFRFPHIITAWNV